MKKFVWYTLSFLLIIIFTIDIKAQEGTEIPGGDVFGHWTAGNSPYYIQGNITLPTDSALIIDPGVEVIFQGNYYLNVFGSLQSIGTSTDSIIFIGKNPLTYWYGISFDTESALNPDQSDIRFCRFENVHNRPGNTKFGAIKVNQHIIETIENCTFQECEMAITLSTNSPVHLIQNCYFDNITGYWAVNLSTNQVVNSFNVLTNTFSSIYQNAIIIEDNRVALMTVNIENNVFDNNGIEQSNSSIIISGNYLIENVRIVQNSFNNINKGHPDGTTVLITENNEDFTLNFLDNTIESCGNPGALSGGIYVDKSYEILFSSNEFTGNQGYKSGMAYINSNRFTSENDVFTSNSSIFEPDDDKSGNGGAIFFQNVGENGLFKISETQFSHNNAIKKGGSIFINILNQFDSIEIKNSSFIDESSSLHGGCLAVSFNGDLNFSGFYNNTFTGNRASEYGGCIYFYSEGIHDISEFESVNNTVMGNPDVTETESYIYYSAYRLPENIRFYNDTITDINFNETIVNKYNRVIHFEDRSDQQNGTTTIEIKNSEYARCNRGIFYFLARHDIQDILLQQCSFEEIHTSSPGGIFVDANHIGDIRIQAGSYTSIINSESDGGVMYFSSATDVESLQVLPYNTIPAIFDVCSASSVEDTGNGGCIYVKAVNGTVNTVDIRSGIFTNCSADNGGGSFYITGGNNMTGKIRNIIVRDNEVRGLADKLVYDGPGGFMFYYSPASVDSIAITGNEMFDLPIAGSGGAFYISSYDIGPVFIEGNSFNHTSNNNTGDATNGGALCMISEQDIESITLSVGQPGIKNYFNSCTTTGYGGCIYAEAGGLIGDIFIDQAVCEDCSSTLGGGCFYFTSGGAFKNVRNQNLTVTNSTLNALNGNTQTRGSGGYLYYFSPSTLNALTITSNQLKNITAAGQGGAFFVSVADLGPVTLQSNDFTNIGTQGNTAADGGVIYLSSGHDITGIEIIPDNTAVTNIFTECYSADNGGCIYARAAGLIGPVILAGAIFDQSHAGIRGGSLFLQSDNATMSSLAQSLHIEGNVITGSALQNSSESEGGFLYYISSYFLETITLASNTIQNISAAGAGGAFYIAADGIGPVKMKSNDVQNVKAIKQGQGADGGIMFISSSKDIAGIYITSSLTSVANIYRSCHSSGSGGCIFAYAQGLIGDVIVQNNNITNCYAGDGGGSFYLHSDHTYPSTITQGLNVSTNTVSGNGSQSLTQGSGGFLYYSSPAYLDSLIIRTNTFQDIYATEAGGALYVEVSDMGPLVVEGNSFQNLKSENDNGGVLCLISAKDLTAMKIISSITGETNYFNTCSAGEQGGCIYAHAAGLIGDVTVTKAQFTDCYAATGGGSVFLQSDFINTAIVQQNITVNSNDIAGTSLQSITGGPGGFMYCSTPSFVSLLEINDNNTHDLTVNGSGGGFYLTSAGIGTATIQNNVFNHLTCTDDDIYADGGAISIFSNDALIENIIFASNDLEEIHGFNNGGALNISGKGIRHGVVDNNTWKNITAKNCGGMGYIKNSIRAGTLNIAGNSFENTQSFSEIPLQGGAVYISGLDTLACVDNNFNHMKSIDKGGSIYMDTTLYTDFDMCRFQNCSSDIGGAVYATGNNEMETLTAKGCSFYQNISGTKGGGLFIAQFDDVIIGEELSGNIFSANQNLSTNNVSKGGSIYATLINTFTLTSADVYGNTSSDGGGIYLDQTETIDLNRNDFMGNIALHNGGAIYLNNVRTGDIRMNGFQYCSSANNGGAIDISNSAAYNDIVNVTDNYFYKNQTREGGAILSNYALDIKRNLFRENACFNLDQSGEYYGSAIYLYDKGIQSILFNSIFDNNLSENPDDGSAYFQQSSLSVPHEFSVQNCTFLNSGENKSVFSKQNKINIVNSLFQNSLKLDYEPGYFNEHVEAFYSDLVFADIWTNNNFDSVVVFQPNCYTFDCDQPVVDQGDPSSIYNDNYQPIGCGTLRNDVGMTGGPHNPDGSSVILCEPNDTLSVNVLAMQDCDVYTFTCPEHPEKWDTYFWFLPDDEILISDTNLITMPMDISPGKTYIKLLVEDTNQIPSRFGFGIGELNVKKLRIPALQVINQTPSGDDYFVNYIPFRFEISATILDKPDNYSYIWEIIEMNGVTLDTSESTETSIAIIVNHIDPVASDLFFTVRYTGTDTHCNIVEQKILQVNILTECTLPGVSFFPPPEQDTIFFYCSDSLVIHFFQGMIHQSGAEINTGNIQSIYTLTDNTAGEMLWADEYNFFEIDPTGIILYPDTVDLCNRKGHTFTLTLIGDQVITQDCKINMEGNPFTLFAITDVGIDEYPTAFEVFPNPTNDKVFIRSYMSLSLDITVYSAYGEKVMTIQNLNSKILELDFHSLPGGIYFIHLSNSSNQQVSSFRIVKE
ncbi:MAG: T9SS type A sorting domain-containing protein [Bacteroidetes bacterium]|nr:T9SS type A sorting domain-containing protein [Bacteroidota bacterium]